MNLESLRHQRLSDTQDQTNRVAGGAVVEFPAYLGTQESLSTSSVNESDQSPEGFISADEFDLEAFFEQESEGASEEGTILDTNRPVVATEDLLEQLQASSQESVARFSSKVTSQTFAAGASLTSGVFSSLSSLVGSCGVFCSHGIGALAQAGGGMGGALGGHWHGGVWHSGGHDHDDHKESSGLVDLFSSGKKSSSSPAPKSRLVSRPPATSFSSGNSISLTQFVAGWLCPQALSA